VTPEAGGLGSYVLDRCFDEVMLETYTRSYPGSIASPDSPSRVAELR
jgi:hypothetical protein